MLVCSFQIQRRYFPAIIWMRFKYATFIFKYNSDEKAGTSDQNIATFIRHCPPDFTSGTVAKPFGVAASYCKQHRKYGLDG